MDESFARNLDQTGQHYMIDPDLIKFIVNSAELEKDDIVLEIGYGKGALTKELVKHCKVIAVDIEKNDLNFISGKLQVVIGNILVIFDELYDKHHFNKIVANIPYNISEPLMKLIFKKHKELESVVLTMGKNFSEILTSDDNRIGIIANHLYDIELLKTIKPRSFSPPPHVDSALIMLEPKSGESSGLYSQLVLLDDRKLKNAFEKILMHKTKKEVKALTDNPLFNKRLYELSNNEFVQLDAWLSDTQLHQI